jgi:phage head maturation protease
VVTTPAYPDTDAQAVQRALAKAKERFKTSEEVKKEGIRRRRLDIDLALLS